MMPQSSLVGMMLHSLVGYEAHPTGMQIVFYVLVLVVIGAGMKWFNNSRTRSVRKGAIP